jgi:hypothetical protein
MVPKIRGELANVLARAFTNEPRDDEPDNVVDALYEISRAIGNGLLAIAAAIEKQKFNQHGEHMEMIAGSLDDIAAAIQGEHEK